MSYRGWHRDFVVLGMTLRIMYVPNFWDWSYNKRLRETSLSLGPIRLKRLY